MTGNDRLMLWFASMGWFLSAIVPMLVFIAGVLWMFAGGALAALIGIGGARYWLPIWNIAIGFGLCVVGLLWLAVPCSVYMVLRLQVHQLSAMRELVATLRRQGNATERVEPPPIQIGQVSF